MSWWPLSALLTVATDTPHSFAISRIEIITVRLSRSFALLNRNRFLASIIPKGGLFGKTGYLIVFATSIYRNLALISTEIKQFLSEITKFGAFPNFDKEYLAILSENIPFIFANDTKTFSLLFYTFI